MIESTLAKLNRRVKEAYATWERWHLAYLHTDTNTEEEAFARKRMKAERVALNQAQVDLDAYMAQVACI